MDSVRNPLRGMSLPLPGTSGVRRFPSFIHLRVMRSAVQRSSMTWSHGTDPGTMIGRNGLRRHESDRLSPRAA
jgi:hypothetical protein